jgi:phosphoribosylformimino-5-aminoimidazole carboxamide ribotide isomerase
LFIVLAVPVLDLLDGVVVHAVRGERTAYRPLHTPHAPTSHPPAVLAGLLCVHPFRHCYVADLNALQGRGDSDHEIAALVKQHAELEFWVDAAFGARTVLPVYLAAPNVRCVIGSESLRDLPAYSASRARCAGRLAPILSLDHQAGTALGPPELFTHPSWWTPQVIAMNLDYVGSSRGPDLAMLARLQKRRPECAVIAAGGVRDAADLDILRAQGVAAVLLATALHDGRVSAAALAAVARP